jgi:hypothetical protein
MKTPMTAFRLFSAVALLTFAAVQANADDFISGIDFGTAGLGHFGILALGGSGATGFGAQPTQLSMNGPGAGVYGSAAQANIGLAGTSGASGWGGTVTVDGTLYYTSSTSGVNTSNQTILGGIVQNNSLLASAASGAASGLATAQNLFNGGCTPGITGATCGGTLSNTTTIQPGNVGGQNVLILSGINIGNNQVITLGTGGNNNTSWVIEDNGDLITNSGSILAQNPSWNQVLVVVKGQEHTNGGLNNESILQGVYIVPTGTAQNSPGQIDGELIAGGNQITFVSGASVIVPEADGMLLYGSACILLGFAAFRFRRRGTGSPA